MLVSNVYTPYFFSAHSTTEIFSVFVTCLFDCDHKLVYQEFQCLVLVVSDWRDVLTNLTFWWRITGTEDSYWRKSDEFIVLDMYELK